jgi:hypothetical protein
MISTNGMDWSYIPMPVVGGSPPPFGSLVILGQFTDITYANGTYYAVGGFRAAGGQAGTVMATSTDLVNWAIPFNASFSTITAGNGVFVAADSPVGDNIYTSADGVAWQQIKGFRSELAPPVEATFQNGLFTLMRLSSFGVGKNQLLSYSSDGLNWQTSFSTSTPVSAAYIRRVAAGGGYYVLADGPSIEYTSALDSGNWTKVNLALTSPQGTSCDVSYGNNVFVAVALGKLFKSGQLTGVENIKFVKQPASASITTGATTTLSVVVQGSDPISFQWRRNGTNLIGQTQRTLTLTNATASSAGDYDVVVTNPGGDFISNTATITVNFAEMLLYAGLTLRGNIGDRFLVEYQDSLDPATWHSISTVTLAAPTYVYIDYDSSAHPGRYYRATFQSP